MFGNTSSPIEARGSRANTLPGPPRFVIYGDKWIPNVIGPPPVSQLKGYNVFALSFLLVSGPFDKAEEWTQLTAAQRSTIKAQYVTAGIKLIVSVFGSTDKPTSNRADPVATANTMSGWVKRYNLDGIDVDYEDFKAVDAGDGQAELLRNNFDVNFRKANTSSLTPPWPHGFHLMNTVEALTAPSTPPLEPRSTGITVQFYNRAPPLSVLLPSNLTHPVQRELLNTLTCTGLLIASSSNSPQTALFQIASSAGIPLSKLVIGKPGTNNDASNGFMSASVLASCLKTAQGLGWNAGVSVWEARTLSSSFKFQLISLSSQMSRIPGSKLFAR
ncbi:glycoside hydrolase [Armillaria luteobubalina]|uniref:Glycoside hydrolase n=1 Tax=Armillaria luteobubalina TaxID=153913 RepID=A0AA39QFX0_9AGAR|nr:glycoside hydrolase [Armillaria luteobubalina]